MELRINTQYKKINGVVGYRELIFNEKDLINLIKHKIYLNEKITEMNFIETKFFK